MWSDAQIAVASDDGSINRGTDYARRGLVRLTEVSTHRITASVDGSESYFVILTARTWDCTCPVGVEGWFCKHCVAVALIARLKTEPPQRRAAKIDLAQLKKSITALRSRGFLDYQRTHGWAVDKAEIVADLERAVSEPGVVPLLQRAAERLSVTVHQADDSSGMIGDLIERVLDAHRQACTNNPPAPLLLANWLLTFGIDEQDFWTLDVDDYATALGTVGVEHYRAGIAARPGDGFAITRAHQRLAIVDRDVDAVIRLVGGDLHVPAQFQWVAEAMLTMHMPELALEWARRGLAEGSGHQLTPLYELAIRLDPAAELELRLDAHSRLPSTSTYALLRKAAGVHWSGHLVAARRLLRPSDLMEVLLADGDLTDAWRTAHEHPHAMASSQWKRLADAYVTVDPAATLPVYRDLIDATLETTGRPSYVESVKVLKALKKASAACGDTMFDAYVNGLREDHRRRPTLLELMDRAGFRTTIFP